MPNDSLLFMLKPIVKGLIQKSSSKGNSVSEVRLGLAFDSSLGIGGSTGCCELLVLHIQHALKLSEPSNAAKQLVCQGQIRRVPHKRAFFISNRTARF